LAGYCVWTTLLQGRVRKRYVAEIKTSSARKRKCGSCRLQNGRHGLKNGHSTRYNCQAENDKATTLAEKMKARCDPLEKRMENTAIELSPGGVGRERKKTNCHVAPTPSTVVDHIQRGKKETHCRSCTEKTKGSSPRGLGETAQTAQGRTGLESPT